MDLINSYIPMTGDGLSLLDVFTYYILMITFFCFAASFFFSWFTRTHVAPEHNTSRVFTAIICLVAGISYFIISTYFKDYLQELRTITDPDARQAFAHKGFMAIGQLRYMDWLVTTPLLLIKMISVLRVKYSRIAGWVVTIVLADIFMIVTGYIGQQQLDGTGSILITSHMIWGAISTIGYLVVLYGMYHIYRTYKSEAKPIERKAFKWMAGTLVTLWGVYPIGYILSAVAPDLDPNYLNIAYSVADVINKAGIGIVAYLMASILLENRIDVTSPKFAERVG